MRKQLFGPIPVFAPAMKLDNGDWAFPCVGIENKNSKADGVMYAHMYHTKIAALEFFGDNYSKIKEAEKYRVKKFTLSHAEKAENEKDYMYSILCRDHDGYLNGDESKPIKASGLAGIGTPRSSFIVGCFTAEDAQKMIAADLFHFKPPIEVTCIKVMEAE